MPKDKIYETDRLLLRPTTEQDAAFVLELLNSPKWLQHIGDRNVHTLAEARQYIRERIRPQQERLGYSNFTLIRKTDQAKIGSCGLYDRPGLEGVDIGFALLPAYEKQGYAFEAAAKMKELAFSEFGLTTLQAITVPYNAASRQLLERLGLELVGTTELPGDEEELLLYRLTIPSATS